MTSQYLDVDDDINAAFDAAYDAGWTDGLPIIPPTEERVAAFLDKSDRKAHEVLAVLPPKRAEASIQKLAVNAVMAGCKPEYFPVIVAAVEALADPTFELYGVNTTTNPVAPVFIINGPIRKEIDLNCSWGCFGPGNRANATIGRALTLALINIAGRIPGQVSKATHAQPGRYAFCFGEHEEMSPWEPLHVERGFRADENTVTALATTGTTNILDMLSKGPEELLTMIAHSYVSVGNNCYFAGYAKGEMGLVLCPPHARLIGEKFKKKQDVKEFLFEHTAWVPIEMFPDHLRSAIQSNGLNQVVNGRVRIAPTPETFVVVVAGGLAGYQSVALPGFGSPYMVTKPIARKPAR